jgi:hypothetical protein
MIVMFCEQSRVIPVVVAVKTTKEDRKATRIVIDY